ncbi:hypothetical protein [Kocuria sp.]|uniref:hypothetical protein n=1 Tax=Kocuria sp. TaxID=1871328 RepID=UPI0026DC34B0|nr:hypothetical protein [Kocuria sp.]MDO4919102.1 hypothetical protein [Kocuria sp.]
MTSPRFEAPRNVEPPSWRSLRRPMVLVVVLMVLGVTAWSSAANYVLVSRDPEHPVDTYLSQLERGSARQVVAPLLVAGGAGLAQLPGNAMYRAAAGRPSHHEIVGTHVTGDVARVAADVRMNDGATVRREYTVHRVAAWGPFNDSWQLRERDNRSLSVHLPATVDALSVNGATVHPAAADLVPADTSDPASPARTWRLEALPGDYDVALPRDSYLLAEKHAPAVIDMADPRPAKTEVSYEASPRMWEEVERMVQQAVGRCASVVRFDASQCPLPPELERAASSAGGGGAQSSVASAAVAQGFSGVRWKLDSRPALLLEPDARDPLTFHAAQWRPATATVTWPRDGRQVEATVRFEIQVNATTTGETMDTQVQLRSAQSQREDAPRRS